MANIEPEPMQPAFDVSHSQSINTIPSITDCNIVSEELLGGQRFDGRMSNVRRFFCLFVTFDLLFTALLWLICAMLTGEDIQTALFKQIYHYNIHSSLFDIVLAAMCRFTILLLFYALLYINHWCIISISTSLTCAFLVAKVFVYDWRESQQPAFEVLLILTSFIISWGEAWFLDFKVLPQELFAKRFFVSCVESERAPLIRSFVQGLPSMHTESVGNFYSPLQSPEGSLYRPEGLSRQKYAACRFNSEQVEEAKLLQKGNQTLEEAWYLLHHSDWKLEKQTVQRDKVDSSTLPKYGKVYLLTAELNISPQYLLEELFYNVDNFVQWNPTILESQKIQTIDEHTDVTYQISVASGVVSSRDFVTLRHWGLKENAYIIAYVSTEHPSLPKNEQCIRGEHRVGCFVLKPILGDQNKCTFQWLLNTNLKGWIPKYILDVAFSNMLLDYVKYLRQHILKIGETRALT